MAKQQTILITGATDGIGLALARYYQQQGARLVLVGRRSLHELNDPIFRDDTYCQADLSASTAALTVSQWLDALAIYDLNLVIQNAGTAYVGETGAQSPEHIQYLLNVNLYAPIALTHALLPRLLNAKGKVVFIGSARAQLPSPQYAAYAASKMALAGFVRNLQIELKTANVAIDAQMIHPGATHTGLHAKAGMASSATKSFASAELVAKQIAQSIKSNRRTVTLGASNRWMDSLYRYFPSPVEGVMKKGGGRKSRSEPKHVVITGVAQGIGKAMAAEFAKNGYIITGIDVDTKAAMYTQAELINEYDAKVRLAPGDLANEDDLLRFVESLATRPPIDVLIHNAGISNVGPFVMSNIRKQTQVLDVNLRAPLVLTAALLRNGSFAEGATIAFMSSLSHFVSYPGAAIYAGSKDGLSAYASALSVGLAKQGMNVLTIYPGPTKTEHARRYSPDNSKEEERMEPELLASLIYKAIKRRSRFLIPGFKNWAMAVGGQMFPGRAEKIMTREVFIKLIARRRK
ncbi:MAG: SDR family NAD(P)-dependent oxidoreductase [Caldilineaceae bacterium]